VFIGYSVDTMQKNTVIIAFLFIVAILAFILIKTPQPKKETNLLLQPNTSTPEKQEESSPVAVVATNLKVPWAIAFLPDKRILVTERAGKVLLIGQDGTMAKNPMALINVQVGANGEGGLLGIALHPNFAQNNFVYLYYTYQSQGNNTRNRIVRMTFHNDTLTDETIIVDGIPGAFFHNGGRIKFGPDGYLYATTGDAQDSSQAQNTQSLAGKILRTTDSGKPAPGNPFGNLVYSYGHRNPQGIAWDARNILWSTEHGRSAPTGYDEINLIESGKNYGWDTIQGNETENGMETPKKHSGANSTWAPAGAVFVGERFFFAGLRGESLYEAVIQNNTVTSVKEHFKNQFGRIREVVEGPDGMLYITTSNTDGRGKAKDNDDKIIRIDPKKL